MHGGDFYLGTLMTLLNYDWNNQQDTHGGMIHDIYLQIYHMHVNVPDVKDDVDNGINLDIRIATNTTMIAVHMNLVILEHHVLQDPFRTVKGGL